MKLLTIPQRIRDAVKRYAEQQTKEREAETLKKSLSSEIIIPYFAEVQQSDEEFTSFETDGHRVTFVKPFIDAFDADALYKELKKKGQLTPEVKATFSLHVDATKLWELAEQLKIDRMALKKFWHQEPHAPYIRVTRFLTEKHG